MVILLLLFKDLEVHLRTCQCTHCPHHRYKFVTTGHLPQLLSPIHVTYHCRCSFQGTSEEVKEHLKTCEYEGVKVYF